MSETFRYAIIGSGRQATATAYDLARYSRAAEIIMADVDGAVAEAAAARINELAGRAVAAPRRLDVRDYDAVVDALQGIDLVVCGVPFIYILPMTRAAIQAQASMVDFGGHTDTVFRQLELDEAAQQAGICVVPDCGMGPGMNNTLGAYAAELLGEGARAVYLWDGGLMQDPVPPWNYQLTFHINGLTNEYYGETAFLRGGKITMVQGLTEYEEIDFPPLGKLEAFITTGGASTAPYTFERKLQVYQNKTCRWPGHFAQFKAFQELGLFEETPVEVKGQPVVPREVYHALLEPKLTAPAGVVKDVCVMRCKGVGTKGGQEAAVIIELIDYYDAATGFTAMERLTGWHAAIMAQFIVEGEVRKGVSRMELAVPASKFIARAKERGFNIKERWES
ncbi:MAG: saccharopine dehydrogenase NADP-binding domain-containing protein [Anaerolineae bacterium]|nr:saccharopine dehydrogenase NADP-binding domain-containing protein [Anaerolineae bacterium]